MKLEQRGKWIKLPIEVRADGDGLAVEGYAAVFNQRTLIGSESSGFYEQIAPGAFRDAIGRDEVVFLYNHDPDTVMARTGAGNLDLSEDDKGLKIHARLSGEDPDAQKLMAKMRAGNIDKMSFAFMVDEDGQDIDLDGDIPVRTINRASLYDVSAVTTPAYSGTEIGMRMIAEAKEAREKLHGASSKAARRRIRMKMRFNPDFAPAG